MITGRIMDGDMQGGALKILYGLSSDTKPKGVWMSRTVCNGSIFHEIDTGNEYMYDEAGKRWVKQP